MDTFFYSQVEENGLNRNIIEQAKLYSHINKEQLYLINKPLSENKEKYNYIDNVLVLLSPKYKIIFINLLDNKDDFEDYIEDFIEDLGSLSHKYGYKNYIGRPRSWREEMTFICHYSSEGTALNTILKDNKLEDPYLKRKSELLISLLTGSINDIDKVKDEVPSNTLDKIKKKIILFDGDQTRFIYQKLTKKRINIQGLSGTGKTELLLHKLKELYTENESNKILFTCFNKILGSNLRERVPEFFTFMKIEEQIKWNERLWSVPAWGSRTDVNSGAYSYICYFYDLTFKGFSKIRTFDDVCKEALAQLELIPEERFKFAFDYILIDESQDFPESFFKLCEKVTRKNLYVAGDIFQDIFDNNIENTTNADFLLSRCYRTDPRTLMFAHSLGMGLFEIPKINWLTDKEWIACGYLVEICHPNIKLTREPLRRFEDLNTEQIESMKLVVREDNSINEIKENIYDIINKIKSDNPTVKPEDISIIFIDEENYIYKIADHLELEIPKKFGWEVNKAYETKTKISETVFVSNKNNVKGLEFPFVICIANNIEKNLKYRNALYMMLTRSFIQSYLLIPSFNEIKNLEKGLKEINETKAIKTTIPTEDEISKMKKSIIKYKEGNSMSFDDFLLNIFNDQKLDTDMRKRLKPMIVNFFDNNFDKEKIIEFINYNKKFFND
ncbi:DEAD/DEAH box helicase [Aliarcobacter butzleri]|uniref:DEAD/DEAH box helicase n=1 Tax=Aliarcobacter butzleri TaxID=28197 RepID=UPI003B21EF40